MHLIHAYIKSIIICASWCMHHWTSIMANASCHMRHFICTWNTPSSCCTIIAIVHLNSASLSWLYIEHLHSELEHFVIISWLHQHKWACFATSIVQIIQIINPEQGCSRRSFSTNLPCYPHLLSLSLVMNLTDIVCFSSCSDLNYVWTWPPYFITIPCLV